MDAAAPVLVLGAGGIADGRGLAAALMLGADGAWIGTRFVATQESLAHEDYKNRLVLAHGRDTVRTRVFGPDLPDFNPMRVVRNRVVSQWQDRVGEIPADTPSEPVVGHPSLMGMELDLHKFSSFVPVASTTGDFEEMPLLAGQGVGLIESIPTVAEAISQIVTGATKMVTGVSARAS